MKAGKTIDEYFKIYFESIEKYGSNTLVLYQKGDFFELYGVDNEEEKIGDLARVSEQTNMQLAKANGKLDYNNRSNPYMIGFPLSKLDKYVEMLLKYNYNTVVVKQVKENDVIRREVFKVYTPATYMNYTRGTESQILASIYVDMNGDSPGKNAHIGLSTIDLNTGSSICYNFYKLDQLFPSVEHTLTTLMPREVIINGSETDCEVIREKLTEYLQLSKYQVHWGSTTELKISYINELLNKVFCDRSVATSPTEYVRMAKLPELLQSYVYLIKYISEHDEDILKGISKPTIHDRVSYMLLSSRTHSHLNLTNTHTVDTHGTPHESIFSLLDQTSTVMGKRFLKMALTMPLTSVKKIKQRYSNIQIFHDIGVEKIEPFLKHISDIERVHRRLTMEVIRPDQFLILDSSYRSIISIADLLSTDNKGVITCESIDDLKQFMTEYTDTFDMTNLKNILYSIRKGINKTIDKYRKRCLRLVNKINNFLSTLINTASVKINGQLHKYYNPEDILDQYILTTTKTGKTAIEQSGHEGFEFTSNKSVVHIIHVGFDKWCQKLKMARDSLLQATKATYQQYIKEWSLKYSKVLSQVVNYVAEVDFIKSLAKVSQKYGYVKPHVVKNDRSFLTATGLRHPLVEVIHTDVPYVSNDVTLNSESQSGILLYGANSAGKSTILKALGISVIMAQIGCFVPAKAFKYSPFHKIVTKMNGEDNLYKGQSTHIVELLDLKEMIEYTDAHSLILADEIASGTETTSAVCELASALQILSEDKKLFMFTTHYHELAGLQVLETLSNIKVCHIEIKIKHKNIIYNRELKDGMGNDGYGLKIATAIDMPDRFNKLAKEFKKKMCNTSLVVDKRSRYNSEVFMTACCVCSSRDQLQTHHIRFQSEADENDIIDGFNKNTKHNLVVLCEQCHEKVHNNQLSIRGYIQTSKGIKLDYKKL